MSFEEAFTPHCWDLRQFGFIVALAQVNSLLAFNYFNRLPHKESCFSKGNFTRAIAECLIFNEEFETDADVGYQAPLTRGRRDLPHGAHFYRTDGMPPAHRLCRHDRFHGKWDGEKFPEIKTMYSKMKCRTCSFEMRTFCYCNWSKPMCTQCHGKHLTEMALAADTDNVGN